MKYLTEHPKTHGYNYETEDYIFEYWDIFFAGYDPRIVKAERSQIEKETQKKTYWRAWFKLPEELAIALDVDNLLDSWPPNDPQLQLIAKYFAWLEECLLDDSKWMFDGPYDD